MVINKIGMSLEKKGTDLYELSLTLANGWCLKHFVDDNDLQAMVHKINEVRGIGSIIQLFNCTEEQARELLAIWGEGPSYNRPGTKGFLIAQEPCKKCEFKREECFKCQFICESPLERSLFLELRKRNINPILQRRIRKDGSVYDYPAVVEKETILTIPDFFLESEKGKVCIYADGKTYHYNNEYQGIRDRSIDIALQNLGYKVLRYTGSQIRDNVAAVVDSIIESI